ncbi:MAG: immune inhibitor A [Candidatus Cloacimonetes bacterium]|nr:immune inhibitor A [Candidatus Cloacimonadota bacterium]
MKRIFLLLLIISSVFSILYSVPPVPLKTSGILEIKEYPSEIYSHLVNRWNLSLPQDILILLVEFEDITFDLIPDYPDSLAHDREYFERLMFHMSSYYSDVSHEQYVLTEDNYTFLDSAITVPNTMGYYGDDDLWIERICEFVQEVVEIADAQLDYNDYDAIIIIHAGAGQESDITGNNSDDLWTTFLTRRSLQAGLDPENDDFPGIGPYNGIYLKEFVICPETEWHSDLTMEDPIYGLLGIITHQFGHQIGLPTLFDNDSSNGYSSGIGSFGLMGTGVWNANGFVPPLPCAWSRYYLGWEDENIVEINSSLDNLQLTFPTANYDETPKIYKINISEKEYFLLENRQQNPDGSTLDGEPSFTFELLPEGEQDVYPPGHPNEGQPKFNFMENTYLGCEWDFYLPGLGGPDTPVVDGSGILIWHIDENIIEENFDPDFETNSINADASHKGVDLEEADGIQHLDTAFQLYSWGSPYDSYREENNTYFGYANSHDGLFSTPTAESNYGGIPLEIYDISESDSLMTFSVKYEWSLNEDFIGENNLPALIIDFDDDGENEIFQALPNGEVYLWKDDVLYPGFPIDTNSSIEVPFPCTYDETSNSVLMQGEVEVTNAAALFQINLAIPDSIDQIYFDTDRRWAGPVVINPDENSDKRLFLPLNITNDEDKSMIVILDDNYQLLSWDIIFFDMLSNLALDNNKIHFVATDWNIFIKYLDSNPTETLELSVNAPYPEIWSFQMADINADETAEFIITSADSLLHVFEQDGSYLNGYPQQIPLNAISLPSFADVDTNGYMDILIGGENTFVVIDKNGVISKPKNEISDPDSTMTAAGVIAMDIDGDDELEVLGNMSRNRLFVWEDVSNNNFELNRNYPVSFGERSLNYPVVSTYSDAGLFVFIPCNNGTIFRSGLPFAELDDISQSIWKCEYANLQRTASFLGETGWSPASTKKVFKKDKTYFYPNPLSRTFNKGINYHQTIPENTIILRIETYYDVDVNIKIFDIAANLLYKNNVFCEADFVNRVYIDAKKMSPGVYFTVLKAKGRVRKLKFAIEK